MRVDRALVPGELVAPDAVDELGPGEHASGAPAASDVRTPHSVGVSSSAPALGATRRGAPRSISSRPPPYLSRLRRSRRLACRGQHGVGRAAPPPRAQRLGDVVVHAASPARDPVLHRAAGGEGDDGGRPARGAEHVETVDVRKPEVEEHEVGVAVLEEAQGLRAGPCRVSTRGPRVRGSGAGGSRMSRSSSTTSTVPPRAHDDAQ